MIPFNKPPRTGSEEAYVISAMQSNRLSGDGHFTQLCQDFLEKKTLSKKVLLTPSCTAALELAALLIDTQPDDEIIMPSYTFVSTANAFVLRGAKIVFVDIRPDTMNIDETQIEQAITSKTKAIVVVHYAGVACEMDDIMSIANRHQLYVIEDAAQAVMSFYKGKSLGAIGHFGCYSFHETKNYTAGGEGGALLINDEQFIQRAEIIREKGTNRSQFLRGQIDKYTWQDVGSSLLPCELQAAYLYGQLLSMETINQQRHETWHYYHQHLKYLTEEGKITQPFTPYDCTHNAHMYYIKLPSLSERTDFIEHMKQHQIQVAFHYVPLHTSPAGLKFGRFSGKDRITSIHSSRLVRLPLWYSIPIRDLEKIISATQKYFILNECAIS